MVTIDLVDSDPSFERRDGTASAGGQAPRWRRWGLFALALVAVAVMVLESLALLGSRHQVTSLKAVSSARTSALASARTYATELASYDYRHIDHDFALVENASTSSFKSDFQNSSSALRPVLVKYHAVASAKVIAAGLESATANHAVADVFINQTVTNTTQKGGPTTDQSRLQITMAKQHGTWLISAVKLL